MPLLMPCVSAFVHVCMCLPRVHCMIYVYFLCFSLCPCACTRLCVFCVLCFQLRVCMLCVCVCMYMRTSKHVLRMRAGVPVCLPLVTCT